MNTDKKSAVRVFLLGGATTLALGAGCIVLMLRNPERSFESDDTTVEEWLATIPGETFRPTYVAITPNHHWAFGILRDSENRWAVRHNEGHLRGNHVFASDEQGPSSIERIEFGAKSEAWTLRKTAIDKRLAILLIERGEAPSGPLGTIRDPDTCEDFKLELGWWAPPIPPERRTPGLREWSLSLVTSSDRWLYALRTARHDLVVARRADHGVLVVIRHAHDEEPEEVVVRLDACAGPLQSPTEAWRIESERSVLERGVEGYVFPPPAEEAVRLRVVLDETMPGTPYPPMKSEPIDFYVRWP